MTLNANCFFGHVQSVETRRCLLSTRAFQANVVLHIRTIPNAAPLQGDALNALAQKLEKLKDFISPQADFPVRTLGLASPGKRKP